MTFASPRKRAPPATLGRNSRAGLRLCGPCSDPTLEWRRDGGRSRGGEQHCISLIAKDPDRLRLNIAHACMLASFDVNWFIRSPAQTKRGTKGAFAVDLMSSKN